MLARFVASYYCGIQRHSVRGLSRKITGKMPSYHVNAGAGPRSHAMQGMVVDFRSDTVTRPTPDMLKAMSKASLGDDVFGEDAMVHQLEDDMAALFGHEKGLFCCTGTMTNQLAMRCQLSALTSVVLDARAHINKYESGGVAMHSQAHVIPVNASNGRYLTLEDIQPSVILSDDVHYAATKVISLECPLNGTIMPLHEIKRIHAFASQHGIAMHLDGARLWNAAVATGKSFQDYGQYFDTISLCLSKGLGAPIGSVLIGTASLVKRAHHFRKAFGGGWRQAGPLAAAALYAIETFYPHNFKKDHEHATMLAKGLAAIPGVSITVPCETNMVWARIDALPATGKTMTSFGQYLCEHGIRVLVDDNDLTLRLVLHHEIGIEAIDRMVALVQSFLKL